jgi:hypothetical protein
VLTGETERVFSLTLPDMAGGRWEPPRTVRRGLPGRMEAAPGSRELWPWLVVLGALGLAFEWLLYGRQRLAIRRAA